MSLFRHLRILVLFGIVLLASQCSCADPPGSPMSVDQQEPEKIFLDSGCDGKSYSGNP